MNFDYDEDQLALREAINRYLEQEYDFQTRQAIVKSPEAFSTSQWSAFASMGWLALPFPEELGGLDGSAVELMLLFEEFGAHAVVEPFLETIVLVGGVLRRSSGYLESTNQEKLIAEKLQGAFAHFEAQPVLSCNDMVARAEPVAGGYRLNGGKGSCCTIWPMRT